MSDKIINTFQERRRIDEAVSGLLDTSSELELVQRVRQIVQEHDAGLIFPVLRKYLNTGSSQMRGGLGRLAALLPQAEVVALLRKEAGRRDNPTQARLTAALILEKFLQVEVSPGLMGDLQDPEFVVMQSLQEALEEGRNNRHVLLEYVRQMRQESEEVAFLVMDLLGRQDPADQPELLRLIGYDSRPGVAQAALDRLGALRGAGVAADSAQALHTLEASLPPELAEMASRNLRKMRFAGVAWQPSAPEGWRALVTPCDFQGSQDLWFLQDDNPNGGTLIGLRTNVVVGILETFASELIERQYLPPKRRVGEMVSISLSEGVPAVFLEVPYGYAYACLRQTLQTHWQGTEPRPLPEEFTLYNPYILQHRPARVAEELTSLLESGPALWTGDGQALAEATESLLRHPAMAGWFLQDRRMYDFLPENGVLPPEKVHGLVMSLVRSIVAQEMEAELSQQFRRALLAQAGWLHIAGYATHARQAVLVAESFRHVPIGQHPLVLQMFEIGLRLLAGRQ